MNLPSTSITRTIRLGLLLIPFTLAGCDYWPPALLTQLEQLRIHVQDLSDERAEMEARLRQAILSQEELQGQVLDLTRQNETLRQSITTLKQAPPKPRVKSSLAKSMQPLRGTVQTATSHKRQRTLSYSRPLMTGKDVRLVQHNLRRLGIPVRVDGAFGSGTRSAVRWFQRKHGLRADGVVGPTTRRHLSKVKAKVKRIPIKHARLKHPLMTGSSISKIQRALRQAGVSVRVDGAFGTGTRSAVKRFQRAQGLRADGVVGPATIAALGLS